MPLSLKERFNYNLYLWLFGLTKVRMINFVSPRIVDIDDTKAVINVHINNSFSIINIYNSWTNKVDHPHLG